MGTNPSNGFYPIWEELGVIQGQRIIDHEQFIRVEGEGGKAFTLYTNLDRLEQHMKELAPEDSDTIEEFINGVRKCTKINLPVEKAAELYGPIDGLKMLPHLGFMKKWSKLTAIDITSRLKNPFLREALSGAFLGDFFPLIFMLLTFAWLHNKEAGYLIGGALEIAGAMERRYVGLGGEIHCKSRVNKILVENDKAVGVRLEDGTEYRGDIVISAADGRTTIFDMLDGKYLNDEIKGYYDQPRLFDPLIYIGLGVARSFDDEPSSVIGVNYPLDKPVTIAGEEQRRLHVHMYNFDPTLAPEGKTVVKVQFNTDYDYWKQLSQEPERYKAEKEQIADQVVALLDQRFPGLAAQVEMRDIATPLTWERYTGNWRGSFEGWLPTAEMFTTHMSKTLPVLENFYMVGQWVEPGGGLPTAARSGRDVIKSSARKIIGSSLPPSRELLYKAVCRLQHNCCSIVP